MDTMFAAAARRRFDVLLFRALDRFSREGRFAEGSAFPQTAPRLVEEGVASRRLDWVRKVRGWARGRDARSDG